MKPSLTHLLTETERFVTAVELVTSHGVITADRGQRVLRLARELATSERIDVLSMTDNPAGNAMLAADTMGTDLIGRGHEVIIHLACKDLLAHTSAWQNTFLGRDHHARLGGEGHE